MAASTLIYDVTNLAQVETINFFKGASEDLVSSDRITVYDNSDNISGQGAIHTAGGGTYDDDIRFEGLSKPGFQTAGATQVRLTFENAVANQAVSNADTVTVEYLDDDGNLLGTQTLYTVHTGNSWGGRMNGASNTEDYILLTDDPDHLVDPTANVYIFGPDVSQSGKFFVGNESWKTSDFVLPSDGYVDGTDERDVINSGYQGDPDGDRVDSGDAILPGATGDDDYIRAYGGNDTVFSGSGDDVIEAGDGNDIVFDTGGVDTIYGGDGDDILEGGEGGDTIDGGAGADTVSYSTSDAAVTVSLDENHTDNHTGGISAAGGHATGDVLTNIENLEGSVHDDLLEGDELGNNLSGYDGDDELYGMGGDDQLWGNFGDDTLDGGSGNDTLYGGFGNDTLYGGDGNDRLDGSNGDDILHGEEGDDVLRGEDGNDRLRGGKGDDSYNGDRGDDIFILESSDNGHDVIDDFNFGNSGSLEDGDQSNNDFVDLSGYYNQDNYNAAVADGVIDPSVIKNPLQWLHADNSNDGVLNDTYIWGSDSSLKLTAAGGTPVYSDSLTYDNTNVICFVAGTLIATRLGQMPVEHLKVGDSVLTRDNGFQTIRWIGSTERRAVGKVAPIRIARDAFGNTRDLLVSPNHRMLLTGADVELMSGSHEVLVAAKYLVDGRSVRQIEGGHVEYFHILFDNHEIVLAEGCWSESFHPGRVGLDSLCEATRQEVYTLFPELWGEMVMDGKATARMVVKQHEATVLRRALYLP
ncbi:Hint domain-containing protein [Celeribacter persicus]|uniref:Ca2+-binding RTX toxin-like protein n=1 Tax=Celeribacter persicus TaxID=1651082 RepID=A0A2T5HTL4_9RHOB|nr:Hint domain-containing protein [Celeribacter persicus]PTQ74930.1 Ca2+-binding RTX toxin-like protein [Celeribacter persicus]